MLGGRHLPSRRAAPCVEGGGPGSAPQSRNPGATRRPPGPVDGARAATATPDPKAGSLSWAQRGGGVLLSIFCLRPKIVGCGRLPGRAGSRPAACWVFLLRPRAGRLSLPGPAEGRVLRPHNSVPLIIGVRVPAYKARTRPVCLPLPCSSCTLHFILLRLVGCIVKQSGNTWIRLWERDGCK